MTITINLKLLKNILEAILITTVILFFFGALVTSLSGGYATTYEVIDFETHDSNHVITTVPVSGWFEALWEEEQEPKTFWLSRSDGRLVYTNDDYETEEYDTSTVFDTNIRKKFYKKLEVKVVEVDQAKGLTRVTVHLSFPRSENAPQKAVYILREDNQTWVDLGGWYELDRRDAILQEKIDTAYRHWLAKYAFKEIDETENPKIDSTEED